MFRAAIPTFRAIARSTATAAVRPQALAAQRIVVGQRWYAASAGLDKEQITSRVLEVLKGFEKVDGGKVSCYSRDRLRRWVSGYVGKVRAAGNLVVTERDGCCLAG